MTGRIEMSEEVQAHIKEACCLRGVKHTLETGEKASTHKEECRFPFIEGPNGARGVKVPLKESVRRALNGGARFNRYTGGVPGPPSTRAMKRALVRRIMGANKRMRKAASRELAQMDRQGRPFLSGPSEKAIGRHTSLCPSCNTREDVARHNRFGPIYFDLARAIRDKVL